MRVLILRNLGKGLPGYNEGQVADVGDREGQALIKRGLAERLAAPAEIKAVPASDIETEQPKRRRGRPRQQEND